MAMRDSVTVSIAELKRGMFNLIEFVRRVDVSTSLGNIVEYAGSNKTSSKARPSFIVFGGILTYKPPAFRQRL